MCGRFMLYSNSEAIAAHFGARLAPELKALLVPRYNIGPGSPVLGIRQGSERGRGRDGAPRPEATHFLWGLIPAWVKAGPENRPDWRLNLFNARLETAAEKPAFRGAWRHRRCLLPADGFYEWQRREDGSKQPWCMQARDGDLLAFAGLWDAWHGPDGSVLQSCTILTTGATGEFNRIHGRMPVILAREDYAPWLAAEPLTPDRVRPCPPETLRWFPVGRGVNNPHAEGPQLIRPLAGETED